MYGTSFTTTYWNKFFFYGHARLAILTGTYQLIILDGNGQILEMLPIGIVSH